MTTSLRFVLFLLCLICTSFSIPSLANDSDPVMTWGEVPMEHLQMKSFPPDSNASAVILFDFGKAGFNAEYDVEYLRHTRIKILTKAGFSFGTHEITYYGVKGRQRVQDVEAHTIILQPDGSVLRQTLERKEIFDEKTGHGWERIRFTLPSLSEGCVVEWRYKIISDSPLDMPNWDFQWSEPALWSEFIYKTPRMFSYVFVRQGYEKFHINQATDSKEVFAGGGTRITDVRTVRLVVKDVPALREEPYITTLDDYRTRARLQLHSVAWPGQALVRFMQTWEKLIEEFLDQPKFGKQLKGFGAVRKQARELTAEIADPLEKLEAIYTYVQNTVIWNERRWIFVKDDLDDVLEAKTGSSAEVNLLLTSMLREAGLKADPVLLSTRANGRIQKLYPIYDQFDYVVCRVKIGEKEHLVDATDRFSPFSLLPRRALNYEGLVVEPGPLTWVKIEPAGSAKTAALAVMALAADGSLSGKIQMKYAEYAAADERRSLSGKKEEEYIKKLLDAEANGITVDSSSITDRESVAKPLVVTAHVSSTEYAQALEDFIYLNPNIIERMKENPFKQPKRSFPVDFAAGWDVSYTFELTIPEGYIIKEYPRNVNHGMPISGGSYTRQCEVEGNKFRMTTRVRRTKDFFEPQYYGGVRHFYQQMVAAQAEQLVLQKDTPVTQTTPTGGKTQ